MKKVSESKHSEFFRQHYSERNSVKFDQITHGADSTVNEKYWMLNPNCGCIVKTTFSYFIQRIVKKDRKCLKCSHRNRVRLGRLPTYPSLKVTNPDLEKFWDKQKNKLAFEDATKGMSQLAFWVCGKGHEWQSIISNVAINKNGCRVCSSQGRSEIEKRLSLLLTGSEDSQHVLEGITWSNGRKLEYDILIREKVVVEYNGEFWHRGKNRQRRDLFKATSALSSGYKIIYILENTTPYIPIEDENLLQIRFQYSVDDAELLPIKEKIETWLGT